MKLTWEYLAAAAGLVVTLLLAWFIGVWVKLTGANLLILRLGIIVLGVLCILGFLMWARGKMPAAAGTPAEAIGGRQRCSDGRREYLVRTQIDFYRGCGKNLWRSETVDALAAQTLTEPFSIDLWKESASASRCDRLP